MYKIGWPFWKILGKMGLPLKISIQVLHDAEANVFVAKSDDLPGLVCESETIELLFKEVRLGITDLLSVYMESDSVPTPRTDMHLCPA